MTYQRNDTPPLLSEGYGLAKPKRDECLIPTRWALTLLAAFAAAIVMSCHPAPAHADTRIGLHLGSQHFGKNADRFNNVNPGVYVYHDGWTAGTYFNSERKQSAYAGYTFEGEVIAPLSYGLTVGAITGYSRGKVLPMVVPSLSLPVFDSGWNMRLSLVPPVGKGSAAAAHMSIERRF